MLIVRTVQKLSYFGKIIEIDNTNIEICINPVTNIHMIVPLYEVEEILCEGKTILPSEAYSYFNQSILNNKRGGKILA